MCCFYYDFYCLVFSLFYCFSIWDFLLGVVNDNICYYIGMQVLICIYGQQGCRFYFIVYYVYCLLFFYRIFKVMNYVIRVSIVMFLIWVEGIRRSCYVNVSCCVNGFCSFNQCSCIFEISDSWEFQWCEVQVCVIQMDRCCGNQDIIYINMWLNSVCCIDMQEGVNVQLCQFFNSNRGRWVVDIGRVDDNRFIIQFCMSGGEFVVRCQFNWFIYQCGDFFYMIWVVRDDGKCSFL